MPDRRPVHQLLAALSYGDAISNEALAIQAHLRRAGYASDIFAEGVHPRMAHLARPLWQYTDVSSPDTVCLFHFSIGSAAGRLIHHAPDRLVAIYHNITPAHFFLDAAITVGVGKMSRRLRRCCARPANPWRRALRPRSLGRPWAI